MLRSEKQMRRFKFSYLAPKIAGLSLVLIAASYAFDSDWPVALGDRAEPNADGPPVAQPQIGAMREVPCIESPECPELLFVWTADIAAVIWRPVLLDADLREVAWGLSTPDTSYHPEGEFAAALMRGAGHSWYVVGERVEGQITSPVRHIGAR